MPAPRKQTKFKAGVWAGSSPSTPKNFRLGLARLKTLKFDVLLPAEIKKNATKPLSKSYFYLAGSDSQKISALLKILRAPKIKNIFCVRGGYGTLRLLKILDEYNLSRFGPKRIWGFSDYTTLQHYLYFKYGWSWVHSPMLAGSSFQEPNAIEKGAWPLPFGRGSRTLHKLKTRVRPTWKKKKAVLLGGNLASLVCLMGTTWEPKPKKKFFLLLEDVSEPARFVDRYLHQLYYSRFFENCIGILTGHFTDSPGATTIVEDFCRARKIPLFSGLLVGHESPNIPLPMGNDVVLSLIDKNSAQLKVPELSFE